MLDREFLYREGYLVFDLESYDTELYSELKNTFNVESAKNSINVLRMDGRFNDVAVAESIIKKYGNDSYNITDDSIQINLLTDNPTELKNELIPHVKHLFQVWFTSRHDNDDNGYGLEDITHKINKKITKELYSTYSGGMLVSELTQYKDGCFIENHNDGNFNTRNCVILIYLNEDWKPEYGGEIIIDGKLYVPPTFGKVVILDFLDNNIQHAVNPVKGDYERYAVIRFINK